MSINGGMRFTDKRLEVRVNPRNDGSLLRLSRPDGSPRVRRERRYGGVVATNLRGACGENATAIAVAYMPLARARARWATRRYRQDYDEALSDALFGLAKALRRGRPGPTFSSYASKTIEGAILRGIRDRSGLRARYERGGDPPPDVVGLNADAVASREPSPPEQLLSKELWREVDRLPGRQSIEVRLTYQYGLSQAAIARLMGVTQMTVSRDLARARNALVEVV
jgi:RNA polymerase sigma factor (sigma-70 family)